MDPPQNGLQRSKTDPISSNNHEFGQTISSNEYSSYAENARQARLTYLSTLPSLQTPDTTPAPELLTRLPIQVENEFEETRASSKWDPYAIMDFLLATSEKQAATIKALKSLRRDGTETKHKQPKSSTDLKDKIIKLQEHNLNEQATTIATLQTTLKIYAESNDQQIKIIHQQTHSIEMQNTIIKSHQRLGKQLSDKIENARRRQEELETEILVIRGYRFNIKELEEEVYKLKARYGIIPSACDDEAKAKSTC